MTSTGGSRGHEVVAVNISALVLAVVTMALRCFVRIRLLKAFGLDDWLMLAATVTFIVYCTVQLLGVRHGTGQHSVNLTQENESQAKMWWWWCYLTYSISMLLAKMSIALFLLRVAVNRVHRRIIHASIAMSVASLLSFFFVCIFQCWPVSYYWNKHTQSGKCVNNTVVVVMAYMFSVVSIITDLIFALVPAWIVSRLNMKVRAKVALIFLMALGCIASAAVVVRLPFLIYLDSNDFLYDTTDVAIMSTVEQGLAIAAGGLATLQPLVKLIGYKLGMASHPGLPGSSRYGNQNRGGTISVRRSISRRTEAFESLPDSRDSKTGGELGLKLQPATSGYLAKCYNTSQEELTLSTVESHGKMSKGSDNNLVSAV